MRRSNATRAPHVSAARGALLLGLLTLALSLAGACGVEAYLHITAPSMELVEGRLPLADPVLGYAAVPLNHSRIIKRLGGHTIFDSTITIDAHGLRSRPGGHPRARDSVLFFAGSSMYGYGLNDDQTIPARFEDRTEGRYIGLNLAFAGYGPHHMLAELEHGREIDALEGSHPRHAVYLGTYLHGASAARLGYWRGVAGPTYELQADGRPRLVGVKPMASWLEDLPYKILLLQKLQIIRTEFSPDEGHELLMALVAESGRVFERKYGGRLLMILLDDDVARARRTLERLGNAPVDIVSRQDVLPTDDAKDFIENDGHLSAQGADRIAAYLASRWK